MKQIKDKLDVSSAKKQSSKRKRKVKELVTLFINSKLAVNTQPPPSKKLLRNN